MKSARRVSRIVAVTGGRDYRDRARVFAVLDAEHETDGIAVLVHGACRSGTDAFADEWAHSRKVNVKWYPARWEFEGHSAGPQRNRRMLDDAKPHLVIAFPGGRGTASCIAEAHARHIPIYSITALTKG